MHQCSFQAGIHVNRLTGEERAQLARQLILRAPLHTKQGTYSHDSYIHKYREVQSNYNKKFEFNLILDLNAECEVAKRVAISGKKN